jgi:hypothetical protein
MTAKCKIRILYMKQIVVHINTCPPSEEKLDYLLAVCELPKN